MLALIFLSTRPPQKSNLSESPGRVLRMDVMVKKLREAGIPAAISDNAGNSLCNQILYEGLQFAKKHAGLPRCGFVHIPALPQQVIERWPNYPFMSLDMIRGAMAIILLELVRKTKAIN